jgi:predicted dehydrogenase
MADETAVYPAKYEKEIMLKDGSAVLLRPVKPGAPKSGEMYLHRGDQRETLTTPKANQYQLMVEHFAEAVLNGTPLRYPPELDRGNMRAIDALYESARTHTAVNLPANLANLR